MSTMRGRPPAFTEEQYEDCLEVYQRGESLASAAATHGMSDQTLSAWMSSRGVAKRRRGPKRVRPVVTTTKEPVHLINLFQLTRGQCMRLKGLCEFESCRYRCHGGGCALKIGGNGAHGLDDISVLVGVSHTAVQDIIERGTKKLKSPMKEWR